MTPTLYLADWSSRRTPGHFGPGPRRRMVGRGDVASRWGEPLPQEDS